MLCKFVLSILLLCLLAISQAQSVSSDQNDTSPAAGPTTVRFPLMAWDYADDAQTMQAMSDCGITSIAFVPPEALDLCEKYGLKAIVFDTRISGTNWTTPYDGDAGAKAVRIVVGEIGDHPAILGYHLKDEPHAREFAELAKVVAAVKKHAPGKWPYINLLPGDGASYDKYVGDFISICKPTAVSYDRYCLHFKDVIDPGFWTNLEQVRELALRHDLPLWNIILTSPHWDYRNVTETDLRMQVFGSLVYGVKGLGYYKFRSKSLPVLNAPDLGNFHNGPLDQFGEKTQTWFWLRNVNRQVHNLAPALLKLKSDDVYHIGGDVPDLCHEATSSSLIKTIPNGEFVVGDFTHEDGSRYVMIVNKNMTRQTQVIPEFNQPIKELNYVSTTTGEIGKYPSPYFWLAPGQGVLLKPEY